MIGRRGQVVGDWDALEDTAREIVFRGVAGAEKSARPIGRRVGRIGLRFEKRNATEMGADANENQELRLDRSALAGLL
jgi:hypothetical protein